MQNHERKIILPNSQKDFSPQSIAKEIESYFVGDHADLMQVLAFFAMDGLPDFLRRVEDFFIDRVNINNLTREQVENLDLKKLAYEFAKAMNIERPMFTNEEIKAKVIQVYGKVARIFIHEILFPEIIKIDPRLAQSVKSQLRRAVCSVAVIEGFDKNEGIELLKIDEIGTDIQNTFLPPVQDNTIALTNVYFKTNLTETQLNRLGEALKTDYQIILSKTEFVELLSKDGQAKSSLRVYRSKIKSFVYLIDQMYNPEDGAKKLISLNKTKRYWMTLQDSILDEGQNFYDRELNKICSELRKSTKNEDIIIREEIKKLISNYQNK